MKRKHSTLLLQCILGGRLGYKRVCERKKKDGINFMKLNPTGTLSFLEHPIKHSSVKKNAETDTYMESRPCGSSRYERLGPAGTMPKGLMVGWLQK